MKILKEFRDFAMKGNVIDLAVGVIIGAAFGGLTKSMVDDLLMPPIGKLIGNLDFTNLYVSLSDKVDAANARLAAEAAEKAARAAATQPATQESLIGSGVASLTTFMDTATRLPLAKAKELGPVVAYGNFITLIINFLIVAFCIFLVVKLMNSAKKKFDKEKAAEAAAPATPPADVVLLTEIRDLLKQRP